MFRSPFFAGTAINLLIFIDNLICGKKNLCLARIDVEGVFALNPEDVEPINLEGVLPLNLEHARFLAIEPLLSLVYF